MQDWYECKVTYEKEMSNGSSKKVTESYLIDAVNYTEAEARFTQCVIAEIASAFTIADIKKQKFAEVIAGDISESGNRWYKCKVMYVVLNDKTGEEKRQPSLLLIQAKDFNAVVGRIAQHCADSVNDWEIYSVTESSILGVYRLAK